jgi:DNA-directed RNA polymerase subunit K
MAETITKFTRYEKARMIGARALQISMGAPFLVKIDEQKLEEIKYNPVEIAKMEYEEGVIPLEIIRRKPEFFDDKSKHPIAVKQEGEAQETAAEDIKSDEDEDTEEISEDDSEEEESAE